MTDRGGWGSAKTPIAEVALDRWANPRAAQCDRAANWTILLEDSGEVLAEQRHGT